MDRNSKSLRARNYVFFYVIHGNVAKSFSLNMFFLYNARKTKMQKKRKQGNAFTVCLI